MLNISLHRAAARPLKVVCITLIFCFMLVGGPVLAAGLTVDQVIGMHQANLPPSVILQTIQSTGATFKLSVSDVKRLKKAGVPQSVIDRMTNSG